LGVVSQMVPMPQGGHMAAVPESEIAPVAEPAAEPAASPPAVEPATEATEVPAAEPTVDPLVDPAAEPTEAPATETAPETPAEAPAPAPDAPAPEALAPEAPAPDAPEGALTPQAAPAEAEPEAANTPEVGSPAAEVPADAAAESVTAMLAPDAAPALPTTEPATSEPATTDPVTAEPAAPETVTTGPVAANLPQAEPATTPPAAPTEIALAPEVLATPEAATAPDLPTALPEAAAPPADPIRPAAALTDASPAAAEPPPLPPLTPEEIAILAPPPEPEPLPEPILDAQPLPAGDVASEPEPLALPEETAILRPVPALVTQSDGVTENRLPRIGDSDPAPAAEAALPDDQPPLQRHARAFDNPSAKPMFALILIDTGGPDVDRAGLAALPFPVSFAIDPAAPDAATAAAIYRAADQEVIMLATGIPQGATASDLAVSFQANAAALPESVAVLDLEEGGFQTDRPLATEVVPVIKDMGRGLITWDKGLNAGDQVARREGLAATMVFRRLDGTGESASTMRRYLDRAAFKAAQDGRVTVVGTTNPDTVKALLEWTVEGRASSVALAPISAVLATP
jgi:hypothetical protein